MNPRVTNKKARTLLPELAELVDAAPPDGQVTLTVRKCAMSSKARCRPLRGGHLIVIKNSDYGTAWTSGVLAHEYGHVVDPVGHAGLWRTGMWRWPIGLAIFFAGAAFAGFGSGFDERQPEVVIGLAIAIAALAFMAQGWPSLRTAMREQELRADARGDQLLGPDRDDVRRMLQQVRSKDKSSETGRLEKWWPHPHPTHRLAALDDDRLRRSS